jgi:hypothetical protein
VKAELAKLGEAPRAYIEKIKGPEGMSEEGGMQIDEGHAVVGVNSVGRLALNERFEKIQGARPGGPPGEEEGPIANGKTLRIVPRPR